MGSIKEGFIKTLKTAFCFSIFLVSQTAYSVSLTKVADIPLPGNPTRFDYQSFDPETKILYFSHMGDGELVVFDTKTQKVIRSLPGFPTMTGILAVPELHRVFASVAGNYEIAVVDTQNLKVVARISGGDFPDGIAYAPEVHKIFVSDERGGKETVIDAETNRRIATIDMGGEIGNTQYDPTNAAMRLCELDERVAVLRRVAVLKII